MQGIPSREPGARQGSRLFEAQGLGHGYETAAMEYATAAKCAVARLSEAIRDVCHDGHVVICFVRHHVRRYRFAGGEPWRRLEVDGRSHGNNDAGAVAGGDNVRDCGMRNVAREFALQRGDL